MAQVLDIDSLENLFNSIRNKLKTQKTVNATLDGVDLKFYQDGNKLLAEYGYNPKAANNTSEFEYQEKETSNKEITNQTNKISDTRLYNSLIPVKQMPKALEDAIKSWSSTSKITKDIKTFVNNGLYKIEGKDFLVYKYNEKSKQFENILKKKDIIKEEAFKKLVNNKKVLDTSIRKEQLDEYINAYASDYSNAGDYSTENRIIKYRNEKEEDENMELKYFFTTDADKNIIVNPEDYEDDFYVHAVTEDNIELKDAIDKIVEEHIKPNLIHVFDDIEDLEIKNFEFDNDENIGSFSIEMLCNETKSRKNEDNFEKYAPNKDMLEKLVKDSDIDGIMKMIQNQKIRFNWSFGLDRKKQTLADLDIIHDAIDNASTREISYDEEETLKNELQNVEKYMYDILNTDFSKEDKSTKARYLGVRKLKK